MEVGLGDDVFRSTDPWDLPAVVPECTIDDLSLFTSVDFELNLANQDALASSSLDVDKDLKLPDLETFQYGALNNLPSLDHSVATSDAEHDEKLVKDDQDIWHLVSDERPLIDDVVFHSWEAFEEPGQKELHHTYISEAGPELFNVAIHLQRTPKDVREHLSLLPNDIFLKSLFALGLGRSSALFAYNTRTRGFDRTILDDYEVCGRTIKASESYVGLFMSYGRTFRLLREYVDRVYTSSNAFAAKTAFARSVATVLDAVEHHLTTRIGHCHSLLQMQDFFERPSKLTSVIHNAMKVTRNARTNEEMADLIFKHCQDLDHEPGWLREAMLPVLARVARASLEFVERWIGILDDDGSLFHDGRSGSGSFVEQNMEFLQDRDISTERSEQAEYLFRPEKLPSFISHSDGQTIFNLGRDIRILRKHDPHHPLASAHLNHLGITLPLDWQFSWQDADKVSAKAISLETALALAVMNFRTGSDAKPVEQKHGSVLPSPSDDADCSTKPFMFLGSKLFDTTLACQESSPDRFSTTINDILNMISFDSETLDLSPPLSVVPALSFTPLLAARQRIVNAVLIRHFLRSHKLRQHLDLQRSFHLLGDGVFVSRLTAALFDADQSSTERRRGTMRSGSGMGLRLGSRSTWPPASSELRLALMGILHECCRSSFTSSEQTPQVRNNDLPGGLSFAIRQLSEEGVERTLKPDSLHALDFLRLHYTPPPPLNVVLTSHSLERYDVIFKFLLRLARLMFVVSRLPRSGTPKVAVSFGLQAEHLVTTCCRYFFDTGISQHWHSFREYLDDLESRLNHEDRNGELGAQVSDGIEDVRKQHDLCLEAITQSLLLRTRQGKVMQVLEDALTTILEFSRLCHEADDQQFLEMIKVKELHTVFQAKVKLFIHACREMIEMERHAKVRSTKGEGNTIDGLVTALDFNGFYGRQFT